MQTRGPLMIEHRLIEKMLKVIQRTLENVTQTKSIDPYFVDKAVDFIRIYADRTHHGKEEDILFKNLLKKKNLSTEDLKLMNELIEDHIFCRNTTKNLIEANEQYRNGKEESLIKVISCLKALVEIYPKHIKREDDVFFPSTQNYFSQEEDQAMLAEFWDFDKKMIHEKYESLVNEANLFKG